MTGLEIELSTLFLLALAVAVAGSRALGFRGVRFAVARPVEVWPWRGDFPFGVRQLEERHAELTSLGFSPTHLATQEPVPAGQARSFVILLAGYLSPDGLTEAVVSASGGWASEQLTFRSFSGSGIACETYFCAFDDPREDPPQHSNLWRPRLRAASALLEEHERHVARWGQSCVALEPGGLAARSGTLVADGLETLEARGYLGRDGDTYVATPRLLGSIALEALSPLGGQDRRFARALAFVGLAAVALATPSFVAYVGSNWAAHVAFALLAAHAVLFFPRRAFVASMYLDAIAALALAFTGATDGTPWFAGICALGLASGLARKSPPIDPAAVRNQLVRVGFPEERLAPAKAPGAGFRPALVPVEYTLAVAAAVFASLLVAEELSFALSPIASSLELLQSLVVVETVRKAAATGFALGVLSWWAGRRGRLPGPGECVLAAFAAEVASTFAWWVPQPWQSGSTPPVDLALIAAFLFGTLGPALANGLGFRAALGVQGRWFEGLWLALPLLSLRLLDAGLRSRRASVGGPPAPVAVTGIERDLIGAAVLALALPLLTRFVPWLARVLGVHTRDEPESS